LFNVSPPVGATAVVSVEALAARHGDEGAAAEHLLAVARDRSGAAEHLAGAGDDRAVPAEPAAAGAAALPTAGEPGAGVEGVGGPAAEHLVGVVRTAVVTVEIADPQEVVGRTSNVQVERLAGVEADRANEAAWTSPVSTQVATAAEHLETAGAAVGV